MTLKLNISPCPNDTFMFHAMVNGIVSSCGLNFNLQFADIEELNQLAIQNIPDVTKISFGVYPLISEKYQLLTSGSALGFGVGPLLISRRKIEPSEIGNCKIALPGEHTTANLLFTQAFPNAKFKRYMLFSQIESAIINGEVDAGVIIHESRFTYQNKGLHKIVDLGQWWEGKTVLPIPLGGIAIKRELPNSLKLTVNKLLRQSIEFAFAHPESCSNFVSQHAQEMNPEVQRAHINLYVNKHSISLEHDGQKAIEQLLNSNRNCETHNQIFIG